MKSKFLIYDVVLEKDNTYKVRMSNTNEDYEFHYYNYVGIAFENIEDAFYGNVGTLGIYNVKQSDTVIKFSSYSEIPKDHMMAEIVQCYIGCYIRWIDNEGNISL